MRSCRAPPGSALSVFPLTGFVPRMEHLCLSTDTLGLCDWDKGCHFSELEYSCLPSGGNNVKTEKTQGVTEPTSRH